MSTSGWCTDPARPSIWYDANSLPIVRGGTWRADECRAVMAGSSLRLLLQLKETVPQKVRVGLAMLEYICPLHSGV